MVKSDKEKGDDEYKAGYDTGRDGDPATRAFVSFFDYTNSDSTYGKGYQEGLSDRHEYGSRSDSPNDENSSTIHNNNLTDVESDTTSDNSYTYYPDVSGSSARGGSNSLVFISSGLLFVIPVVYLLASGFVAYEYGHDFAFIMTEKFGAIKGILITLFFLPGVLVIAAVFVIFLIITLVLTIILSFFGINL